MEEEDVVPEIIWSVHGHVKAKTTELVNCYATLGSWSEYLQGYKAGIKHGVELALDLIMNAGVTYELRGDFKEPVSCQSF